MKFRCVDKQRRNKCRPPHGGRGLKYIKPLTHGLIDGRPPHGGRGLKYVLRRAFGIWDMSPPARGAWIEIQRRQVSQ